MGVFMYMKKKACFQNANNVESLTGPEASFNKVLHGVFVVVNALLT